MYKSYAFQSTPKVGLHVLTKIIMLLKGNNLSYIYIYHNRFEKINTVIGVSNVLHH